MGKDNRVIHRGVGIGGQTFLPEQEDELSAAATSDQLELLKATGAIEGDWQATGAPLEAPLKPIVLSLGSKAEVAATYISSMFGIERSGEETAEAFVSGIVADLRALQSKCDDLTAQVASQTTEGALEQGKKLKTKTPDETPAT